MASLDGQVDLLSRVHHRNLVSLLGYCNESKELMLVYEHMSGGSLRDHLYGKYVAERRPRLSCCILDIELPKQPKFDFLFGHIRY